MSSIGINAGTSSRRGLRAGPFDVSQVTFAGGRRLGWHAHPRACVAVIVEGLVSKRFTRLAADAGVGTLVSMPAEESHEDLFGREGANIVVVESDDGVESVSCFADWGAMFVALRIARELDLDDAFSSLAVEGLALELAAAAARGPVPRRPERWLEEAYELLHERFREMPTAAQVAAHVGVHPAHLARSFRSHYRESIGGCARRLRLEWAAVELVRSDTRLVSLAIEAGFVDQSHFTRAFKKQFGMTPARYRAAHR
ncbi:MAG: AraC family transcriptional regulator [Gaiellaceae bacterium]